MNLSVTSVAPFFLIMALLALTSSLLLRIRFFADVATSFAAGRFETLDGLRGYLALTVFFHHAVARHFYRSTGVWQYPDSALYGFGPQIAVALFFMITGFLFWLKAMRSGGGLDWKSLYRSRLRRLLPLYLLAIASLLVTVGFKTGWQLRVPSVELAKQAGRWLAFNFLGTPDINGLSGTWTIEGVIWSLKFE